MLPFYDINAKLRYIKFCLLLFTFLFVLTGISLIVIGSTVNSIYYEFMYFLTIGSVTPANGLVGIGFLMFAIAVLGLIGTIRLNPHLIRAFGGCLGIICLLLLSAAIASRMVTDVMIGNLRVSMNQTMYDYTTDATAAERMNVVQENFACCGMYSVRDWQQVFGKESIPPSCCAFSEKYSMCEFVHNVGCYPRLALILNDSGRIVSTSSGVLALMQLLGMAFAFYMSHCLGQQIRARRDRKLLMTQQLLFADAEGTKSVKNVI